VCVVIAVIGRRRIGKVRRRSGRLGGWERIGRRREAFRRGRFEKKMHALFGVDAKGSEWGLAFLGALVVEELSDLVFERGDGLLCAGEILVGLLEAVGPRLEFRARRSARWFFEDLPRWRGGFGRLGRVVCGKNRSRGRKDRGRSFFVGKSGVVGGWGRMKRREDRGRGFFVGKRGVVG